MEAEPTNVDQSSRESRALVQCAIDGDLVAFETLVHRYHKLVLSQIVRIVREPDLADEVCQDTFYAAFESLGKFRFQSEFSTWLTSIARNKAISALRSRLAQSRNEQSAFQERVAQWSLDIASKASDQDHRDTIDQLRMCLDRLEPQQRMVIDMFYGGGQSAESIGKETQRSASGIRMMLLRLRKLLHQCIQDRESNQ